MLRRLLADVGRFDWSKLDLAGAVRCTIGVAIPLVIGLAAGSIADAVFASIGSLCAGFASFQGAYRRRVFITLLVAVGMAVATVTGAFAMRADWPAIVVVAIWGAVAGMIASLGQAYLVIGLQWGAAAIIVNNVPMTTGQALVRGALVAAGGCIQTVIAILTWSVRTYPAERTAVATAYRDLASAVEATVAVTDPTLNPHLPVPATLDDARVALTDPQPFGRSDYLLAFQALVDEAERIRIRLGTLKRWKAAVLEGGGDVGWLDQFLVVTASALRSVATAVVADTVPSVRASELTLVAAPEPSDVSGAVPDWIRSDLARTVAAVAGQVRGALSIAAAIASEAPIPERESARLQQRERRRPVRDAFDTLAANLNWQSVYFRHALRLSVTLAVAMVIYRLTGLPHGYWIALTVLLVLRPDYGQTALRGVSRLSGTLAGAVLATLLIVAIRPDETGLTAMLLAAVFAAFLLVQVNYAFFSLCVTTYVVFILAFAAAPALSTAGDRVLSTLIGGALAFGAYLVWPTWESSVVGVQLSRLLEAQSDWADTVLTVFADPGSPVRRRIGDLRSASRLARSNAEASVQRMAGEPERSRRDTALDMPTVEGALASCRRISSSLLTLQAHLPTTEAPACEPVQPFAETLTGAMRRHAARLALESPVAAGAGADLREAHGVLASSLASWSAKISPQDGTDGVRIPLLVSESDLLVDAVDTVGEVLERSIVPSTVSNL